MSSQFAPDWLAQIVFGVAFIEAILLAPTWALRLLSARMSGYCITRAHGLGVS